MDKEKEIPVDEIKVLSDTTGNIQKVEEKSEEVKEVKTTVDENSDDDMAAPETKKYEQYLVLKKKFFDLLNSTLYQMPYNTILTLGTGQQTKLSVLLKFIEEHKDHFQIADMNQIIVFISAAPYHIVKPFMEYVEDNAKQSELWSLLQE